MVVSQDTDTLTLIFNETQIEAKAGSTILEVARDNDIYIPSLCAHPAIPPSGECGICLVEIEGDSDFALACTRTISDNITIRTDTPEVRLKQRQILEKMLAQHPSACLTCWRKERCKPFDVCLRNAAVTERCVTCPQNGRCELQEVVDYLDFQGITIPYEYRALPINRNNPVFDLDYNLCIACGRCVRACHHLRGNKTIDFIDMNNYRVAGPVKNNHLDSGCRFCGACVDICPTGALTERSNKLAGLPERITETICPYCGVGCQLALEVKNEKIIRVTPVAGDSINQGQACVKGRFGITEYVHHAERLTTPLIRKKGELVESSWEEALELVSSRLQDYKGDRFAFIASAKCTNEENYLAQKFTRTVMQTNNIDHCARL